MQESKIELSIVVNVANGQADLGPLLKRLRAQHLLGNAPFEVVFVGRDLPVAQILAAQLAFRLVGGDAAATVHARRNQGARAASGAFVAFINADCRPGPHWVASTMAQLRADPSLIIEGRFDHTSHSLVLARDAFFSLGAFCERPSPNEDRRFIGQAIRAGLRLLKVAADPPSRPARSRWLLPLLRDLG